MLTLAQYAEQNSANDIADAAYSAAIKIAPKNRGAYDGRLRLALAARHTAQAQTIAAEIAQVWPDDVAARNQNAYLRLLLGASGEQAEAAEREADVLVKKQPLNWLVRATLGLARLRLGKYEEALAAIREPRVTGGEPPGALAVRAAILAANGYGDLRCCIPQSECAEDSAHYNTSTSVIDFFRSSFLQGFQLCQIVSGIDIVGIDS